MSTNRATALSAAAASVPGQPDRRARRRQQTIEEILAIAADLMTEEGVNGLTLAGIARRLGVQPPSLYKYFPSITAVYDALFERGMVATLEIMRTAASDAPPGLPALAAALEANGRYLLDHPALAQLMYWRPVPSFDASEEAMSASREMVEMQRHMLREAVDAGQLGAAATDSDEALYVVASLISGVTTMAMANDPGTRWGQDRFTPVFPHLLALLPARFPPD
jgi:AcrR family transcriptional regulator